MPELKQFKLPDVGEGLTEADIIRWLVKPGDAISINQVIVEIETAKAVVELPSPYAGVVQDLLVPEGTTADVGTPIISVEVGAEAATGQHPAAAGAPAEQPGGPESQPGGPESQPGGPESQPGGPESQPGGPEGQPGGPEGQADGQPASADGGAVPTPTADVAPPTADLAPPPAGISPAPAEGAVEPGLYGSPAPKEERQAVLVGYGVKLGATKRRPRKPAAATSSAGAAAPPPGSAPGSAPAPRPATAPQAVPPDGQNGALAKPPIRKLAKDLGVDLAALQGTGPSGSITREDVQAAAAPAAAQGPAGAAEGGPEPAGPAQVPDVRLASLPREERITIRGVRKHTAAAMAASAFTAPHVTEFLQIDITQTMAAAARLRSLPEFEGIKVSPLVLVAKALLVAAARHPMINSSWDEGSQEIVVKHYVNLGIAAATERGLVVPTIKDAHALSLPGLARSIADLTETARAGKSTPADLRGGTITITNVGVFGVDTGTPIITPGEAAILAFGQVKDAPWVVDGQLAVRKVCTLSLAFDHRIVDGDLGSAVLRDVGAMLTEPLRLLAWS